MLDHIAYRDELPPDCPPRTARETREEVVYRFTSHDPPHPIEDFKTARQEKPAGKWAENLECRARGISVYPSLEKARAALAKWRTEDEKRIRKRQPRKKKWRNMGICRVRLAQGAGAIVAPSSNSGHATWWPSEGFDIAPRIQSVDPASPDEEGAGWTR